MNMLQTCCLSQLSADMMELPVHILSSVTRHDDSRLPNLTGGGCSATDKTHGLYWRRCGVEVGTNGNGELLAHKS